MKSSALSGLSGFTPIKGGVQWHRFDNLDRSSRSDQRMGRAVVITVHRHYKGNGVQVNIKIGKTFTQVPSPLQTAD